MTWVKLDDNIAENPKIVAAGEDAAWLYVVGLCYCSRNLTDGSIPSRIVLRLVSNRFPRRLAARLVEHGLWIEDGENYRVVDYLDHQRSRSDVLAQREQGKERAARSRERHANAGKGSRERALLEEEGEEEGLSVVPDLGLLGRKPFLATVSRVGPTTNIEHDLRSLANHLHDPRRTT